MVKQIQQEGCSPESGVTGLSPRLSTEDNRRVNTRMSLFDLSLLLK